MTDLLHTIPDFPIKLYTHLIPSLEKHLVTTTDLLTLDALEIAKRAQLPLLDVRRLANHVLAILQGQLGLKNENAAKFENLGEVQADFGTLKQSGKEITTQWNTISTLDLTLDAALGGGIPTGYITELTGESGAGKTQLLLSLLLSAQISPPNGLSRPTLYISTESPLPTLRLNQLLHTNPLLFPTTHPPLPNQTSRITPSLSNILTLQTPDLESQDHILTYQLPLALSRHNIGLVVIDSVTANYRAGVMANTPAALATRSTQLAKLGALLRNLAREHDCAVVVANQVGDRFESHTVGPGTRGVGGGPGWQSNILSSSPSLPEGTQRNTNAMPAPNVLSLDHQQRFFTGWGSHPPPPPHGSSGSSLSQQASLNQNLKTPSLGLVWANQIACRVALVKESDYGSAGEGIEAAEWNPRRWRRWMRVAFSKWAPPTGDGERGVEFEIWGGGLRAVKGEGEGEERGEEKGDEKGVEARV